MTFSESQQETSEANFDLPTAALNFKEFSFMGEDGDLDYRNASDENRISMHQYLSEHYGAVHFDYKEPFLIISCEDTPPDEDERPFSVAGLIAIWTKVGEFNEVSFLLGESSPKEEYVSISAEYLSELQRTMMPKWQAFMYLALYIFTDCIAIALAWGQLIVELPLIERSQHIERVQILPGGIEGSSLFLQYYNGPLPNTAMKRMIAPSSSHIDGQSDTTDYVREVGAFYPGSMIRADPTEKGQPAPTVSAGILVEKGYSQRLVVSYHAWRDQDQENPRLLGSTDDEARSKFKVVQGMPGSEVGFVRERLGDTDIALAQINHNVVFKNEFLDLDSRPKCLLHSKDVSFQDEFIVDGFSTGKQRLVCGGKRLTFERRAGDPHPELIGKGAIVVPDNVPYIILEQNVCTTNSTIMTRQPHIRAGICGAALLRYRISKGTDSRLGPARVMERGEIAGMIHFAHLQTQHLLSAHQFLVYADTYDPLIEGGWSVVQAAGDTEA